MFENIKKSSFVPPVAADANVEVFDPDHYLLDIEPETENDQPKNEEEVKPKLELKFIFLKFSILAWSTKELRAAPEREKRKTNNRFNEDAAPSVRIRYSSMLFPRKKNILFIFQTRAELTDEQNRERDIAGGLIIVPVEEKKEDENFEEDEDMESS